jgi:aryl-alcohol dehydrogenase-like predicted oxidoreductase
MLNRSEFELELAEVCADQEVGVIPYSPLAAGFLTGKYTRENKNPDNTRADGGLIQKFINDENAYKVMDEVRRIATDHDVPEAHVALAWQLAHPVMTSSIIGARTVGQLEEVIGAVELELLPAEIEALNTVSAGF